ncbi:transposase (plasmid) [Vibrio campbellii]|nr:transposase [Vibrio campbellii]
MPVDFLEHQHDSYGSYCQPPTSQDLSRCFHLDDLDLELISEKRGAHNRLGFALQLSTLRYLGLFIKQPFDVPDVVIETLQEQLSLHEKVDYQRYLNGSQRWHHIQQIREYYGYTDLSEGRIVFYFCRWLYALCWSGIDRPKVLFEKAQY